MPRSRADERRDLAGSILLDGLPADGAIRHTVAVVVADRVFDRRALKDRELKARRRLEVAVWHGHVRVELVAPGGRLENRREPGAGSVARHAEIARGELGEARAIRPVVHLGAGRRCPAEREFRALAGRRARIADCVTLRRIRKCVSARPADAHVHATRVAVVALDVLRACETRGGVDAPRRRIARIHRAVVLVVTHDRRRLATDRRVARVERARITVVASGRHVRARASRLVARVERAGVAVVTRNRGFQAPGRRIARVQRTRVAVVADERVGLAPFCLVAEVLGALVAVIAGHVVRRVDATRGRIALVERAGDTVVTVELARRAPHDRDADVERAGVAVVTHDRLRETRTDRRVARVERAGVAVVADDRCRDASERRVARVERTQIGVVAHDRAELTALVRVARLHRARVVVVAGGVVRRCDAAGRGVAGVECAGDAVVAQLIVRGVEAPLDEVARVQRARDPVVAALELGVNALAVGARATDEANAIVAGLPVLHGRGDTLLDGVALTRGARVAVVARLPGRERLKLTAVLLVARVGRTGLAVVADERLARHALAGKATIIFRARVAVRAGNAGVRWGMFATDPIRAHVIRAWIVVVANHYLAGLALLANAGIPGCTGVPIVAR